MKEKVYENLVKYYNNISDTGAWKYDIYASVQEWAEIVYLGYSYQDRLNILKMLYIYNCSLDDLKNMTLDDLLDYIKETDDLYEQDKVFIDECVKLIKMYEN